MSKKYAIEKRPTILTLGTAQLGSHYGVANKAGCPCREEAFEILEASFDNGVRSFDTAWSYGNSESAIGDFIVSKKHTPFIISKLPDMRKSTCSDLDSVYKVTKRYATESLERLKIDRIQVYLLHSALDMGALGGNVIKSLSKIKSEGLIEAIGVSVYYPDEVEEALSMDEIDAIQLPVNIFDHRFIDSDLLKKMNKSNKSIFARSVFLQGLFFLEPDALPPELEFSGKYLRMLRDFSIGEGVSIHQLALGFLKSIPEISSIVIGAESKKQVLENINIFDRSGIDRKLKERLLKCFSDVPLKVKMPVLWFDKQREGGHEKKQ